MASLTLKNVPPELLNQLHEVADRERRSLTQQILVFIERALAKRVSSYPPVDKKTIQVERWNALAGRWQSSMTSKQEIRDIYKARTKGRNVNL